MRKTLLMLGVALSSLAGCATNSLQGQWQYSDGNTMIGLNLQSEELCELSLSRFVRDDLKKTCRYETNKHDKVTDPKAPQGYLVFLHDDAGNCDVFADFEFNYDRDAELLTFLVGDTPFVMERLK